MRKGPGVAAMAAISAWIGADVVAAAATPPPAATPPAAAAPAAPLPGTGAESSPDAFYLSRMAIGQQALSSGRAAEAADNLRVASFGLLGDPPKLSECLVWLAIAQERAGRTADVDVTLRRFQAVQALFPSYSSLAIQPQIRSEFEALARKRAPGMVLDRPREAERRAPPPSAASTAPPAPAIPPVRSPGAALAASLRPVPAVLPVATAVPPARLPEPAASRRASAASAPKAAAASPARVFDREFRTRSSVIFEIRPDQARLFVDGRFVGVSADWGGAGGRPFPLAPGEHTVRAVLPGYREARLRVVADPSADADTVAAIELSRRERRSFRRIPRPDYVTAGRVAFAAGMRGVEVAVDGEATGLAERFTAASPLRLSGPAVHDVVLSKPGRPARTIRILASPTAGGEMVVVRTVL